ncbi:MAG: DUF2892 domain-containing protein [Bdellovibrio sp.]|nr:MAG: DUF2892 domain-containing protein [Bdellovibrio sp.]
MKKNVGKTDAIIRTVVGLALVALAIAKPEYWWGYLGLVLIATAFFRFCALYPLLGINTCGGPCDADKPKEGSTSS